MKMKVAVVGAIALSVMAAGAQASAVVTSVVGDPTTWKEGGASVPTFEGGVMFGETLAFSLNNDPFPGAGTAVTFGGPSVLVTGVQADQLSKLVGYGTTSCFTAEHSGEHCAAVAVGVKEVGRDYSAIGAYDVSSGAFTADSGGVLYYKAAIQLYVRAEGVVNGTIVTALGGSASPLFVTDGHWLSLTPLQTAVPVPEPATWALFAAGFAALSFVARRRHRAD